DVGPRESSTGNVNCESNKTVGSVHDELTDAVQHFSMARQAVIEPAAEIREQTPRKLQVGLCFGAAMRAQHLLRFAACEQVANGFASIRDMPRFVAHNCGYALCHRMPTAGSASVGVVLNRSADAFLEIVRVGQEVCQLFAPQFV